MASEAQLLEQLVADLKPHSSMSVQELSAAVQNLAAPIFQMNKEYRAEIDRLTQKLKSKGIFDESMQNISVAFVASQSNYSTQLQLHLRSGVAQAQYDSLVQYSQNLKNDFDKLENLFQQQRSIHDLNVENQTLRNEILELKAKLAAQEEINSANTRQCHRQLQVNEDLYRQIAILNQEKEVNDDLKYFNHLKQLYSDMFWQKKILWCSTASTVEIGRAGFDLSGKNALGLSERITDLRKQFREDPLCVVVEDEDGDDSDIAVPAPNSLLSQDQFFAELAALMKQFPTGLQTPQQLYLLHTTSGARNKMEHPKFASRKEKVAFMLAVTGRTWSSFTLAQRDLVKYLATAIISKLQSNVCKEQAAQQANVEALPAFIFKF